jgi:hypothetical protein
LLGKGVHRFADQLAKEDFVFAKEPWRQAADR